MSVKQELHYLPIITISKTLLTGEVRVGMYGKMVQQKCRSGIVKSKTVQIQISNHTCIMVSVHRGNLLIHVDFYM